MIGAREFALMRPHAYFITTARGFIHDEAALLEALRSKLIAGAGLDVWAKEPPPPDHPLLQFDNVLASPHTAGVTRRRGRTWAGLPPSKSSMRSTACARPRLINPEVWPHYVRRFRARIRVYAGNSWFGGELFTPRMWPRCATQAAIGSPMGG